MASATLNELYRPFRIGPDATAANAELNPETLAGGEAGTDLVLSRNAKASLTVFTAQLHDAIANVTVARGPGIFPGVGFINASGSFRQRQNLHAIVTSGAEIESDVRHEPFELRFSYAFVDARVKDKGAGRALDGLRPAQIPESQTSATIGWSSEERQRVSLTGRAVSSQYEDDLNQRRLAPALTIDAFASTPTGYHVTLGLRAENLLDGRVEAAKANEGTVEARISANAMAGSHYKVIAGAGPANGMQRRVYLPDLSG